MMASYLPPIDEILFVMHEVLGAEGADIPGYAALTPDLCRAVLTEAGRLATGVLAPLNASGDRQGCRLENGRVATPAGFPAAFDALRAGGWNGLDLPEAYGGQGLPHLLYTAAGEIFCSANMALNMYQGLTHGAVSTILAHGTEAQKALYVPPMVALDWTGTMNLTEAHCGTDLGLIRTRAEPRPDGSFRITGQKIFISAGDHDLARNIVHLVLARAPEGEAGTKGLSLFIVPKFLPDAAGQPGAPNALGPGRIETKMGIHANATCAMDYDGATGFLLGELHKGMRAMFTMMNEALALVSLVTPVIKAFLTDQGFRMTVEAQQIFGGHGYIEDSGIAQFVRDARIAMIYEGANGIQAIDLLARKLGAEGGRGMRALSGRIEALLPRLRATPALAEDVAAPLEAALADVRAATLHLATRGATAPASALAGASDFLAMTGHLCLGYMAARLALADLDQPAPASPARRAATRHLMRHHLPATALHLARIRAGTDWALSLQNGDFA
jgi:alkylation response protein AidB-like acyl-CoA dehydrogenase